MRNPIKIKGQWYEQPEQPKRKRGECGSCRWWKRIGVVYGHCNLNVMNTPENDGCAGFQKKITEGSVIDKKDISQGEI